MQSLVGIVGRKHRLAAAQVDHFPGQQAVPGIRRHARAEHRIEGERPRRGQQECPRFAAARKTPGLEPFAHPAKVRALDPEALRTEIVRHAGRPDLRDARVNGARIALETAHADSEAIARKRATAELARVRMLAEDAEPVAAVADEGSGVFRRRNREPLARDRAPVFLAREAHVRRRPARAGRECPRNVQRIGAFLLDEQQPVRFAAVRLEPEAFLHHEIPGLDTQGAGDRRFAEDPRRLDREPVPGIKCRHVSRHRVSAAARPRAPQDPRLARARRALLPSSPLRSRNRAQCRGRRRCSRRSPRGVARSAAIPRSA